MPPLFNSGLAMLTLIAAMDRQGAIGRNNQLLWSLPADMAHFKASTTGKTILMGSVTAHGLGRSLPKRLNLVLTSQPDAPFAGQVPLHSIQEVLAFNRVHAAEEIMVCGGAKVYQALLPHAQALVLTHVDDQVTDADAFFPLEEMRAAGWVEDQVLLEQPKDDRHAHAFVVKRYVRAPN
jgi:dihydrofolate reductase